MIRAPRVSGGLLAGVLVLLLAGAARAAPPCDEAAEELPAILRGLERNHYTEKAAAEKAFVAWLRRADSPQVYFRLEKLLPELTTETQARVIAGIGKAGSDSGTVLLAGLLPRAGPLESTVLSAISKLPRHRLTPDLMSEVAEHFRGAKRLARRECVFVLRNTRDPAIVAQLVEALPNEEPAVRHTIFWALGEATGVELPPDEGRWRDWLRTEREWWRSEGRALLAKLSSRDSAEALAALHALAGRPHLHDREIDAAIAAMMGDPRPAVAVAARRIGSGRGIHLPATDSPTARPSPAAVGKRGSPTPAVAAPAGPSQSARFALLALALLGAFAGTALFLLRLRGRRRARTGAMTLQLDPERRTELLLKSR